VAAEKLASRIAALAEHEPRLRALLMEAGQRLAERQHSLEVSLDEARASIDELRARPVTGGEEHQSPATLAPRHYEKLIHRVHEIIAGTTMPGSTVLIVSRGDSRLVQIEERIGWHFPRDDAGLYAGYHPASSADAIGHLETLHESGASYLVFPSTAFWWLDYYGGLAAHLDERYRRAWRDDSCAVYELTPPTETQASERGQPPTNWLAELILDEE
jgi:hypothetical protein